jgi:hypothetical protein
VISNGHDVSPNVVHNDPQICDLQQTVPVIWQDAGMSRIDSTVIHHGASPYRFTKDEGGPETGCTNIIQERSSSFRTILDIRSQVAIRSHGLQLESR